MYISNFVFQFICMVLLQSMTIDTVFHKSGLGNMKDSLKRYNKLLFLFIVSEKIAVAHQILSTPHMSFDY